MRVSPRRLALVKMSSGQPNRSISKPCDKPPNCSTRRSVSGPDQRPPARLTREAHTRQQKRRLPLRRGAGAPGSASAGHRDPPATATPAPAAAHSPAVTLPSPVPAPATAVWPPPQMERFKGVSHHGPLLFSVLTATSSPCGQVKSCVCHAGPHTRAPGTALSTDLHVYSRRRSGPDASALQSFPRPPPTLYTTIPPSNTLGGGLWRSCWPQVHESVTHNVGLTHDLPTERRLLPCGSA